MTQVNYSTLWTIEWTLQARLFLEFCQSFINNGEEPILALDTISKGVINYPASISPREIAEKRGKAEVEFINFWRTDVTPDFSRMNTYLARKGLDLAYSDSSMNTLVNVKPVPVTISYDIFFWTTDREKLNRIVEHYINWQQTNPNLNALILGIYPAEFDIHFTGITDESPINDKYTKGQYFVLKMGITIDAWTFVVPALPTYVVKSIHIRIFDKDNLISVDQMAAVANDDDKAAEREQLLMAEWEQELAYEETIDV